MNKTAAAKRLVFVMVAAFVASGVVAQNTPGGASSGMAGSYLVMHDVWSSYHNQAGLVHLTAPSAGIFYENRFGMNELSDKGIAVVLPFGNSAFGMNYKSFGYSQFSSSKTGLSYALKLSEKFSCGLQFNLHTTRLGENYGTQNSMSVEGGFLFKLNEKLSIAAHLYNPTRARLSDFNDERIPSVMRAGAGYRFSKKVILTAEVRKPSDADASVRGGVEYWMLEQIALRAGFGSHPSQYSFGFGWKLKTFQFDVATGYHQILGFTPQLSLTYQHARN